MARAFMPNMGGTKGGAKKGSIGDFAKKNPDFMKMDPGKRNELLMNLKMDSKKAELATRKPGGSFQLPGAASAEKELSKSAKDMIEKMIQKQIKKRQKEVVSIRACWFGNGRITKDGKIYDASNKLVGQIDKETMKIRIGMMTIGKYKDDSFTLTKLQRKLDSMGAAQKKAAPAIGIGNFYGTADSSTTSWW